MNDRSTSVIAPLRDQAPIDLALSPRFFDAAVDAIQPSRHNPRTTFEQGSLDELAESMRTHGLAQPILIRPVEAQIIGDASYELVAGERRWRAARLIGWTTIPAMIRSLTDLQALELQVIENLQREDLHPLEEAEGYERLVNEHGYAVEDLAAKVGKSPSYVYTRMKLLALVPEARTAFRAGKLSPATAILVARMTPAVQEAALKEVSTGDDGHPMSVRAAADLFRRRFMLDLRTAPFDTESAKLVPVAGPCTTCPKRTGNQRELFADVGNGDTCTDPDCFGTKRTAHWHLERARLERRGIEILEGDAAAAIAPYGPNVGLRDGQTMTRLLDEIQRNTGLEEQAAQARLQEVMKAAKIKPSAFIAGDEDEVVQFLPTDALAKVREAIQLATPKSQQAIEFEARLKAEAAERERSTKRSELTDKFEGELVARIVSRAEQDAPTTITVLRLMAFSWWRQTTYDGENTDGVLRRWTIEPIDNEETTQQWVLRTRQFFLDASPDAIARAMLAMALADQDALGEIEGCEWSSTAIAREYGIDVDQLRKELVDDILDPPGHAVAKIRAVKLGPKYRNERTGETWSGRGKQPKWVEVALERGQTLADLEILPER